MEFRGIGFFLDNFSVFRGKVVPGRESGCSSDACLLRDGITQVQFRMSEMQLVPFVVTHFPERGFVSIPFLRNGPMIRMNKGALLGNPSIELSMVEARWERS